MCSIHDQFKGFLASKQLNVSDEVGVKDLEWNPEVPLDIHTFSLDDVDDQILLGKKAERFFSVYLQSARQRKILVENIQIIENNVTLGELDAIIQEEERIIHLELVYKFYLLDPKIEGEEILQWIGPNRKDHLLSKLTKLRVKQLPLLSHPATLRFLAEQNLDRSKMEQEVLFLANCFVPLDYTEKVSYSVDGFWCTSEQIGSSLFENRKFFIPSKHHWMSRSCLGIPWQSQKDFLMELEKHLNIKRSPLIWIKNNDDSFNRAFVVWW